MKFHDVCVWWLIHIHGTALVKGIAHLIIDSDMLMVVVLLWCSWDLCPLQLWYLMVLVVLALAVSVVLLLTPLGTDGTPFYQRRRMTAFGRCRAVFTPGPGGRLYAAFGSTLPRSRFDASPSRPRRICQARRSLFRCSVAVPITVSPFCGRNDRLDKSCTSAPCEG